MENILFHRMFPDFKPREFQCPCAHPFCPKDGMEFWFLSVLQATRRQCAFPFKINSGFRCAVYNATLDQSSPQSNHIKGIAADISISRLSAKEKYTLHSEAFLRFNGVGVYPTFLHVDLRSSSNRSFWTGL